MSSPERNNSQNHLSPSERMTKAWRKMVETNQFEFYMTIGTAEIEKLGKKEVKSSGSEHIANYLQAVQDLIGSQPKQK